MRIIYLLILALLITTPLAAKKKKRPPLARGPGGSGLWGEKTPLAKWGTRCIDTDTNTHYWFGGAGGISKKGPLLTYVFTNETWIEIKSNNIEQLKLIAEIKVLELDMRNIYTSVSNRYYQSELALEKSHQLDADGALLLTKLKELKKKLKHEKSLSRLKKLIASLGTYNVKLKGNISVKEVAEGRRLFRELVQIRWTSDTQPSPRSYSTMAYDSKTKKIILFGGEGIYGVYADTWLFDVKTKIWQQVFPESSPAPRCAHGMAATDGKAYLVGGYNARGSKAYCTGLWFRLPMDVWQYDIEKNTWILIKKDDTKPVSLRFQRRVKVTILPDKNSLSWYTGIYSYGKKKGEIKGEIKIPGQGISDHQSSVPSGTIQIRSSAFDPAHYEEKPVSSKDSSLFQAKLKNLPSNKWINMTPPTTPAKRDWGTTILDLKRDQLLHWAGGHSSHCGTDIAHYSLKTNRWHIAYTPEIPFESTYGVGYGAPSLSGRPFGVHTYLSYAIDQVTGKMLWAGAGGTGGNFKIVNPSGVYLYDIQKSEWSYAKLKFQNKQWGYMEQHMTCMVATPKGIVVWMPKRRGTGSLPSGLWLANLKDHLYEPLIATDKKDKTTLPKSAYGDGHGMTYDSKRDRALLFHFRIKNKFKIWSFDLTSKKLTVLTPKGSENFPNQASFPREATYIPGLDIVYIPTAGKKYQADLIYDCAKNEWLKMNSAQTKNKRGRSGPGYGVSTGIEWDPKRKLLWLVQSNGTVYAMRLDLKTANLKPLEPRPAPVKIKK